MGVFQNNLMGAAAAAASAGGGDFYSYQIANSLRMSDANNTTLKITAGTPTSSKTFTYSWWWKRYNITSTSTQSSNVFCAGTSGGAYVFWPFTNGSTPQANFNFTGGNFGDSRLTTNMLFRDPSAWYHCVLRFDSTQATASNRVRLYVNGVEPTYSSASVQTDISQNEDISFMNQDGVQQGWGGLSGKGTGQEGCDVQLADIILCDGQSYGPDSFGETKNGVWIPKDPSGLTFGNNGYYLNFASSSDLGNDVSGNNNDFTPANLSAHDQMLDTPTFNSDSNGGNFCVMNPLNSGSNNTFSEGNLKVTNSSGGCTALGTMSLVTGHKWYFEGKCTGSGNNWIGIIEENGYTNSANTNSSIAGSGSFNTYLYGYNGYIYYGSSSASTGATFGSGDIMGVLVDLESGTNTIQFYKNGTAQGSAFNLTGTGINYTPMSDRGSGSGDGFWFNFGQEGTFGTGSGGGNSDATGYGSFYYDDGAAAKAICTGNLPTADAVDPAQTDDNFPQKMFSPLIWTGDGNNSRAITGLGFQPDWLWFKSRSSAFSNRLYDTSRGISSTGGKRLFSNTNGAEVDQTSGQDISAVGTDGFTTGASSANYNNDTNSGGLNVAWCWRANGGTTSTNTQGSVDSTVQTDPSGAFSIVTWAGGGGAATIGHGLSGAPSFMVAKSRTSGATVMDWVAFHQNMNGGAYPANESRMYLNSTGGYSTGALWQNDNNSSTVFGVTSNINNSSKNYVAYCFTDVEGYCKAGYFEGNGNTNGPFVYTGFRPSLVMRKRTDGSGSWLVKDDARNPTNDGSIEVLTWNDSGAENPQTETSDGVDFLSNGFKLKATNNGSNGSGLDYIYLALSFNPFKYSTAF